MSNSSYSTHKVYLIPPEHDHIVEGYIDVAKQELAFWLRQQLKTGGASENPDALRTAEMYRRRQAYQTQCNGLNSTEKSAFQLEAYNRMIDRDEEEHGRGRGGARVAHGAAIANLRGQLQGGRGSR